MDLLKPHRVSFRFLLEVILPKKVRLRTLEVLLPHFCYLEGVSQVGSLNNCGPFLRWENRTARPLFDKGEVAII